MHPAFAEYLSRLAQLDDDSTHEVDALVEKLDTEYETRQLVAGIISDLRRQFSY